MRNSKKASCCHKQIRFGIVGEYQSGKSLLINCLLKRPIATVGSGTATTRTVVNYRYANKKKQRVEYVGCKGEINVFPVEEFEKLELDKKTDAFEVNVYLYNSLLKDYELVDMPGFGADESDSDIAIRALRGLDFAILVASNDKALGAESSAVKDLHKLKKYRIPYYFILNCRDTEKWSPDDERNREIANIDLSLFDYKPMVYPLHEDGVNIVNFMWYWYSVCDSDDKLINSVKSSLRNYEICEEAREEVRNYSNFYLIRSIFGIDKNAVMNLINKIFKMDNRAFLELRRQMKEEIGILCRELCPIGTIQAFAFGSVPNEGKWKMCDGSLLKRKEYAELFDVINYTFGGEKDEFALPDLRGRFIRGWDNNGAVDKDRVFGSVQDDALQEHSHTVESCSEEGEHRHYESYLKRSLSTSFFSNIKKYLTTIYDTADGIEHTTQNGSHVHSITIGSPSDTDSKTVKVAAETRPVNVALMFCIKVK